jgi:hypothetical protein
MKDQRRRTPPADPTSEPTADQSTQENSGLHQGIAGVRPGPGPELARKDGVDDAALPADDSTLNTKI